MKQIETAFILATYFQNSDVPITFGKLRKIRDAIELKIEGIYIDITPRELVMMTQLYPNMFRFVGDNICRVGDDFDPDYIYRNFSKYVEKNIRDKVISIIQQFKHLQTGDFEKQMSPLYTIEEFDCAVEKAMKSCACSRWIIGSPPQDRSSEGVEYLCEYRWPLPHKPNYTRQGTFGSLGSDSLGSWNHINYPIIRYAIINCNSEEKKDD